MSRNKDGSIHIGRHRKAKATDSKPIPEDLALRLYHALERRYPGKVWFAIEVCPVAVIKTIDNERDALETLRRIEKAEIADSKAKFSEYVAEKMTGALDGGGE